MQITFNPLDPREVADAINLLRLLGTIDAAVRVEIEGEPTLTEAEARKRGAEALTRYSLWRGVTSAPAPTSVPSIDIGDL